MTKVQKQDRNSVRSSFFAGAERNKKLVDLHAADGNTIQVEVREPNFRQMDKISKKGADDSGIPTGNDFWIWGIIECTYMPGTDEKVFEDGDYEFFLDKQIRDKAVGELVDAITGFILISGKEVDELKND